MALLPRPNSPHNVFEGVSATIDELDKRFNGRITGANIQDGSLSFADLASPAFTSYVPAWTSNGTQPVLNNGVIAGIYYQIGKLVVCKIALLIGSTTTFGTGIYFLSIPVTSTTTVVHTGTLRAFDTSAGAVYMGMAYTNTSTTVVPITTAQPAGFYGPTVPFTWATGDLLSVDYIYEAA